MKNTHLKTPLLVLMTTILIAMCSCDSNDTDMTENANTANLGETRKTVTLSKDQMSALRRRAIIPLENTVTEIVSTSDPIVNGIAVDDYFITYELLNDWIVKDAETSSAKLWIREERVSFPARGRRNLVIGLLTDTVDSEDALTSKQVNAVRTAVQRYNALNMEKLRYVTVMEGSLADLINGDADTIIEPMDLLNSNRPQSALGFFPTRGNPGSRVLLDPTTDNLNQNALTVIIQHELGHTLGLIHSDFRTRRSCQANQRFAESISNIEAIPGTNTTGTSTLSIMRACAPQAFNNFQADDRNSLRRAYGGSSF
jgi:hypothetical protein